MITMRTLLVLCVALGLTGGVATATAGGGDGTAAAGLDLLRKEFAQGANTAWSDCPWDAPPADGEICHTYSVDFLRSDSTSSGGPIDRAGALFAVFFQIVAERYHANSDSFDLVAYEFGGTTDVTGSSDTARLTFAQIETSASIQLLNVNLMTGEATPTGQIATLSPMTWIGSGDMLVFGNDGPTNQALGVSRHSADRCSTSNFNSHQRIRPAQLTAALPSIDGVPVYAPFAPDPTGAIFSNVFHFIDVMHNCG
jgi:hypothetical protein